VAADLDGDGTISNDEIVATETNVRGDEAAD
jgi:hypothetical protein